MHILIALRALILHRLSTVNTWFTKKRRMATKGKLVVVAALAFTALAANENPASLVVAKEVAEAFGEALKEEQPLLKNAELHKSAVMASKDDLVAALANPGFRKISHCPIPVPPLYLERHCTDTWLNSSPSCHLFAGPRAKFLIGHEP